MHTTTQRKTTRQTPDAVNLLLSDARGIYIPRDFCTSFDLTLPQWSGIKKGDAMICTKGPDHEWYWEAWQAILDAAVYTDNEGNKYHLYQDGDLWLLDYERMTAEERRNFGMDTDPAEQGEGEE